MSGSKRKLRNAFNVGSIVFKIAIRQNTFVAVTEEIFIARTNHASIIRKAKENYSEGTATVATVIPYCITENTKRTVTLVFKNVGFNVIVKVRQPNKASTLDA